MNNKSENYKLNLYFVPEGIQTTTNDWVGRITNSAEQENSNTCVLDSFVKSTNSIVTMVDVKTQFDKEAPYDIALLIQLARWQL